MVLSIHATIFWVCGCIWKKLSQNYWQCGNWDYFLLSIAHTKRNDRLIDVVAVELNRDGKKIREFSATTVVFVSVFQSK